MRLATLFGPDFHQTLAEDPQAFREALEEFHEEDIAEIVEDLPTADIVALLRVLPDDFGAGVLARLPDERRTEVLEGLKVEEAATLLAEMEPDERADAVQELEQPLQQKLLAELDKVEPEAADEIRELARYPEGSVGSIMTTSYVACPPDTKIWKVIDEVRRLSREGELESIYYVYGVAFGDKLVGVASLRDLILADPSQELADVMTKNVVRVLDTEDREEAARVIAKYDFHAMPVVDGQGKMVGVVTVDDVVDVVIDEATEDAQKMGAVSPMEGGYFQTSFFEYWKSRVTWLVALFLGGFLTANVMQSFEGEIQRVVILAVFIPLIISTGGNAGSQSATLIIRALSLDEVKPADWLRVLGRELLTGLALGVVVGALGFARAWLAADHEALQLAVVVSTSIVAVVTVGSLVGSLLPLLIQRLGLDPAVSSTPFIASLSDVIGLLVYLGIARAMFV
ncbi:MAG: magnesium transporter [Sandaracinaceae bacterium]